MGCSTHVHAHPVEATILQARSPTERAGALLHEILGDCHSSIFSVLSTHLTQDPALPPLSALTSPLPLQGSPALRPSPTLNNALTTLVERLVAPLDPEEEKAALALLDGDGGDSLFASRALAIRCVAAAAERELEMTTAQRAVLGPTDAVHEDDVSSFLSHFFPYCRNYELLCAAEIGILGAGGSANVLKGNSQPASPLPLEGKVVCFVGSGPLPLSGILLHCRAGADVVLVDVDEEAVQASEALLSTLESRGLIRAGAIRVVCADACAVRFVRSQNQSDGEGCTSTPTTAGSTLEISCDAVILASLLADFAKARVAAAIATEPRAPSLLLVRSATGLVSRMAYERVQCRSLERSGLKYLGEWIPRRGQISAPRKPCAVGHSVGQPDRRIVLGTIHSEVLNSVEVYQRATHDIGGGV